MAHWRSMTGKRDNFDVADLGGRDLVVQIESAKPGVIAGFLNGAKAETRAVMVRFVGHDRPLGFKPTLCKSMVQIYGTGDIDQWPGKWIKLIAAMVRDPSGGPGAMCEAVRISPIKPTGDEIAAAQPRGAGKAARPPARDEAADEALVKRVCEAIDAAGDVAAIEAAIGPNRDELKKMGERHRSIVASAKAARLATLEQQAQPAPEGATDVPR